MLYDPKWEKQTGAKPDLLSLDGLIAWLITKPSGGTYNYIDCTNCLIAQYLREAGGLDIDSVGPRKFSYYERRPFLFFFSRKVRLSQSLPKEMNESAHAFTYGGALKYARRAIAAKS